MPDLPHSLPAPQSAHPLELQFRRLLHSCETLVEEASTSGKHTAPAEGSGGPRISPFKLRHYVDTLRDQLSDLRNTELGLEQSIFELYEAHIKALVSKLPAVKLPPFCKNITTGTRLPGAAVSTSYFTPPKVVSTADLKAQQQALNTQGLSAAAQERLVQQTALQDVLTDELVGMAAQLKQNTYSMQDAVNQRGSILDVTEKALDESAAAAKISAAKAKEQYRRSRGNFCLTLLVLLVVGLVFSAMVFYIKFTHLTGYRAPQQQRYTCDGEL